MHTVSFNLNGGSGDAPANQNIAHTQTATAPTERPTRDGYDFTGWYTSKSYTEESSFTFETPITSSLTLYAGWTPVYHVVTFATEDADTQEYQLVAHDDKAKKPTEEPTKSGYTFGGWYEDEGCNTPFNFDTSITADTMVYARWESNKITATFDVDGGAPQPIDQIVYYGAGAKVIEPEQAPTKDGRALLGWYVNVDDVPADAELAAELAREIQSDPELNGRYWLTEDGFLRQSYDFDSIPETDLTLYARYEKCIVSFDADGGAPEPEAQTVDYDGSPTKPAEDPVKDGYTFDGWWLEGDDEPFDFETDTVTGDVTLRAHWAEVEEWQEPEVEANTHTIVFDSNGGSEVDPKSQQVAYGEHAQKPADPTRPGFNFLGWYEDVSWFITVQEYEEHKDELQNMAGSLRVFDGKVMMSFDPESDPVYYDMEVQAQWELNPNYGLTTEVVLGDGVPTIKVSNLDEIASSLVTEEELDQGVVVRLVVNAIDKSALTDAERAALEAKFKELGATDYQWLDISLIKIVGDTETKIETLKTPLKFTVEIPEAMRAANRTHYLVRMHGGKAQAIANGKDTVLAAESDKFSTYVLAYMDVTGGSPKDSPKQGSTTQQQNKAATTSLAHTGDSTPTHLMGLVAGMVLAASAILGVAKRIR